ncbi:MAG: membrane dipeptidase, partial [Chitinophagaceae bacterium]|nr:membrane dipeptidase [Chitinophagaceae bacterium]
MKGSLLFLFTTVVFFSLHAQKYKKLHEKVILVDTHNDILTTCFEKHVSFDQNLSGVTQSDIQRFKTGGMDVQVFSIWCGPEQKHPYNYANQQIDTLYATALRNPAKMVIIKTPADFSKAIKQKKLGAMMGVEGGHMIQDNLAYLDSFYRRGVRYMTLTWNNSTSWATSAQDETIKKDSLSHKGLTDFGRQVVKRMNELGMLIDISHVGEQTFWDAINTTKKPVIASHSCVYS